MIRNRNRLKNRSLSRLLPRSDDVAFPITIDFDGDEASFFDGGWSEVGGNTLNDQIVLGSDVAVNGGFDSDTSWSKTGGWTIGGGVANHDGSGGANSLFQSILSLSTYYQITFTTLNIISGGVFTKLGALFVGSIRTTAETFVEAYRASDSGGLNFSMVSPAGGPYNGDLDNVIVEAITLSSILNPLKDQFGLADGFFIDIAINTVGLATHVGVAWNIDDVSNPTNFGVAVVDGTNILVDKFVAGTTTRLASVAQAVTQDQILRIENPAGSNVLDILYNGVSKATPTISDAGIISNTGIALFSTEASNAISKVTIGRL